MSDSTKPTAGAEMSEEALRAIEAWWAEIGDTRKVGMQAKIDVLALVAEVRRQREEIAALTARAEKAERLAAALRAELALAANIIDSAADVIDNLDPGDIDGESAGARADAERFRAMSKGGEP